MPNCTHVGPTSKDLKYMYADCTHVGPVHKHECQFRIYRVMLLAFAFYALHILLKQHCLCNLQSIEAQVEILLDEFAIYRSAV